MDALRKLEVTLYNKQWFTHVEGAMMEEYQQQNFAKLETV